MRWLLVFVLLQVVELLVKRGADLNVKDANEMTPLHHLVMNKFDVLAIWFARCGGDIHQKDRKMFSPLDYGLPSTQQALREAAGEVIEEHSGAQAAEAKAPMLYRTPAFKPSGHSAPSERRAEVRVRLPSGAYKTVRINDNVTGAGLARMAANKFNIEPRYEQYIILYEVKQGAQRQVRSGQSVMELHAAWPHIITADGNQTNEKCYFVVCFHHYTSSSQNTKGDKSTSRWCAGC